MSETCNGQDHQKWVYNRMAGGTLTTIDGNSCIEKIPNDVKLKPCVKDSAVQAWVYTCSAWVNGEKSEGRMITLQNSDIISEGWLAVDNSQLWKYEEVVKHTQCKNKRFKTLKFDGSFGSTVHRSNFLSMPTEKLTITAWMKGRSGCPISYASNVYAKSFVMYETEHESFTIYIKDFKVVTGQTLNDGQWAHLSVTWSSETGKLKLYKDAELVFEKSDVMTGEKLIEGGCFMLGQMQETECDKRVEGMSYDGEMSDVGVWRKIMEPEEIKKVMGEPVPISLVEGVNNIENEEAEDDLRLLYGSRQYASHELGELPGNCPLDEYKKKPPITGPSGNMNWRGQGDVHYGTFGPSCKYDDQSVGEWAAVQVKPESWSQLPLMVQFRTSPQTNSAGWCTWCQDGAVSYIDGCAIRFHDDQCSAGFGGWSQPYDPFGAFKTASGDHQVSGRSGYMGWKHGSQVNGIKNCHINLRGNGRLIADLTDGTRLDCRKYLIALRLPKKYTGHINGLAGTGLGAPSDWTFGPNSAACPECVAGQVSSEMANKGCSSQYTYHDRNSPFNGNSNTKPVVRWFQSWQVDGHNIPSIFYYSSKHSAGSFNRKAGEQIKPISDVNNSPTGKKAEAEKKCEPLNNSPKAKEKCIFDFMAMGGGGVVKETVKDREAKRETKKHSAVERDIRDMSKYKNDGTWAEQINWGCVGEFLAVQEHASGGSKLTRNIEDAEESTFENGVNVAGRGLCGVPFSSGSIESHCDTKEAGIGTTFGTGIHCFSNINDGIPGNAFSWIPGDAYAGHRFVGVRFDGPKTIQGFRISRDGSGQYGDRTGGSYEVQYTHEPAPDQNTAEWKSAGSFSRSSGGYIYKSIFPPVSATGLRIIVTDASACIDELEVYANGEHSCSRECTTYSNTRKKFTEKMNAGGVGYGADVPTWEKCLASCQEMEKCAQVVFQNPDAPGAKGSYCYPMTTATDATEAGDGTGFTSAHCVSKRGPTRAEQRRRRCSKVGSSRRRAATESDISTETLKLGFVSEQTTEACVELESIDQWTDIPGLKQKVTLAADAVVLSWFQVSMSAGSNYMATKLRIDGADRPATRWVVGNTLYGTWAGALAEKLNAGEHTIQPVYRSPATDHDFNEGGSDWATRSMSVVVVPQATILAQQLKNTATTFSASDNWQTSDLSEDINLVKARMVQVIYQIATDTENAELATQLFVDDEPQTQTRSVVGKTAHGSTMGMWFGGLSKGAHKIEVKYVSTSAISFPDGGADWQTRSLTVLGLGVSSKVLAAVSPTESATLNTADTWETMPGLEKSVTISEQSLVQVWYQVAVSTGGSHLMAKLFVDDQEAKGTRSAVGDTDSGSVMGNFVVKLSPGKHTFEVKYKTPGAQGFDANGGTWQTRSMSVVVLGAGKDTSACTGAVCFSDLLFDLQSTLMRALLAATR